MSKNALMLMFLTFPFPCLVFAINPATCTFTNYRDEAVSAANSATYYRGDAIRLTNCVIYSGASGSAVQNLSGLTVRASLGDGLLGAQIVTGIVQVATSGTWSANSTIRTNEGPTITIEVQLTDGTNTYTYPQKTISTKPKL